MHGFKTKWFGKWSKKNRISDNNLIETVKDLENQKSSANLGSGLFKVRLARKGGGKSGGYRTLLAYKKGDKFFFIYAFAKNEKANLSSAELDGFKKLGQSLLAMDGFQISSAQNKGSLIDMGEI